MATTTKPAEASTTPTPRTTIEVLRLTFDGESCVYEGPTVLTPGPVQLVFVNEGQDYAAAVGLEILDEGKTFQDYIDHIGPEPSSERAPAWAHGLGTWKRIKVGDSQMWEGDLEPGLYGILCQELSAPSGIWLGSTLTVEE